MASTTKPDTPFTTDQQQRKRPLAPFRSRDFSLLWFGSFVSQAGSQMHIVAVSWQVYELTKDPLTLGGIGVARIVPLVLLALGSGVLADALDRRKLMLFSQIAMMLCSAALALASSLGVVTVWWIYIVTALSSAASTLGMPARQAIVPSLVPREQLLFGAQPEYHLVAGRHDHGANARRAGHRRLGRGRGLLDRCSLIYCRDCRAAVDARRGGDWRPPTGHVRARRWRGLRYVRQQYDDLEHDAARLSSRRSSARQLFCYRCLRPTS